VCLVGFKQAAPRHHYEVGKTTTTYHGFKDAHEDIQDAAESAMDKIEDAGDHGETILEKTAHRGVSQELKFKTSGVNHLRAVAAKNVKHLAQTARHAVHMEHAFVAKSLDEIDAAAVKAADAKLADAKKTYTNWNAEGRKITDKYENVIEEVAETGVEQEEAATAVALEAVQAAAKEAIIRKKAAASTFVEVESTEDETEDAVLNALEEHFSEDLEAEYLAAAGNPADIIAQSSESVARVNKVSKAGVDSIEMAASTIVRQAQKAQQKAAAHVKQEEAALLKQITKATENAVEKINHAGHQRHGHVDVSQE
jgi:hypothetical protein